MAAIWHMTANFGRGAAAGDAARAFETAFSKKPFGVPNAGRIVLNLNIEGNDSGWECHVLPYVESTEWHLNDHAGPNDEREAEDLHAAALVLYHRLSLVPSGYLFALYGCEVGDWRDAETLEAELSPDGFLRKFMTEYPSLTGLVVKDALSVAAGDPPGFSRFSLGYSWIPWTKEGLDNP